LQNKRFSTPGKVFILGEYAVLAGLPGLVATVPPRFSLSSSQSQSFDESSDFHPESPIARLQGWAEKLRLPRLSFQFEDPLAGAGGFGASTAQFAMAYLAYSQFLEESQARRWSSAWRLYRELMGTEVITPSGADLVAQWQGGVVFFDPSDRHCLDVWPLFDWSRLIVFSATSQVGRKVATHSHLRGLVEKGFPQGMPNLMRDLEKALIAGISAVRENDVFELGKSFDDYAESLQRAGLECAATFEDRLFLRDLSGVCGVKGAGAEQSDAVLVLLDPKASNRNSIITAAEQRGLRLVSDGLTCEMGVTCQSGY
jgi:mevalonate kinase